MHEADGYIIVEVGEAGRDLPSLVEAVHAGGRRVRIVRDGKTIAELGPPAGTGLPTYPELAGVKFNVDPVAPLDPEDWPESSR